MTSQAAYLFRDASPGDELVTLVDWHERLTTAGVLDRLAAVAPLGGTPLADEMTSVATRLAAQRAERRVLLVICDGEPSERRRVTLSVEDARAVGLEVYGVGIGDGIDARDMDPLFGDGGFVLTTDLGALPRLLENLLLPGKRVSK